MAMTVFPVRLRPTDYAERFDAEVQFEKGRGEIVEIMETLATPMWYANGTWRLTTADMLVLEPFIAALGGADAFWFHSYRWRKHTGLSGGTGNGSNRLFPIPCSLPRHDLMSPVAYVAGVTKTLNTDFTVGHENRVVYSEDLSQTGTWVAQGSATVTRTGSQTDPLGGSKAYRIQTSGGSLTAKLKQTLGAAATSGYLVRTSVWIKNLSATKAVTVDDGLGSSQTVAASADKSAPWTEVVLHSTSAGSAGCLQFSAPASGDALDFRVFRSWVAYQDANLGNPEARWCYVPTGSSAITMDSRGRAQVVFFPAATAPAAGSAVTADLAARYVHSARLVPGSAWAPKPVDWNMEELSLDLQTATEE